MCGRFSLPFMVQEVVEEFDIDQVLREFNPNYNIAPMQDIAVILAGSRILDVYKWGLLPHWAKDQKITYKLINARAETVAEKPAYRKALETRCLIPAGGFFEWKKDGKNKIPYYITLKKRKIFALGGITSIWTSDGKTIKTCSIVTTGPNKFMKDIHDRMPLIIPKDKEDLWLKGSIEDVKKLMVQSKEEMQSVIISTLVNSPKNNSPELLKPVY